MKCIKLDKPCNFRDENNICKWHCKYNYPQTTCEVANAGWGCPWNCIYEAIREDTECSFKEELKEKIKEEVE